MSEWTKELIEKLIQTLAEAGLDVGLNKESSISALEEIERLQSEVATLRSQRDRLIEAGSPCVMFYSLQSGNNSDEVADWRALVDEITAED